MKWEQHSDYTWVRFNKDNKYDVISIWETIPQFENDKYQMNIDHYQIKAKNSEDAYEKMYGLDDREIHSFENKKYAEVFLKEKFGIEVNLENF